MKINKNIVTVGLMMFLTIITQVFSLYKSSLMAKYFGTSVEISAFNFVNNISFFVFGMVGAAVATVVIPQLVRKDYKSVSIFLNFLYVSCVFLAIIVILTKYTIVKLISGTTDVSFLSFAATIIPIVMFSNLIMSLNNFMIAVFQVNNGFNYPKVVVLLTNIALVTSFICLPKMSVFQFVLISSIANIANLLLLFLDRKHSKFDYKFSFDYKNKEFREMVINMLPIFVANGAYQMSLLVDTGLSSRIGVHNITILSYSTQIAGMISGLFVANLMSYIYPRVAQMINQNCSLPDLSKYLRKLSYFLFGTMLLIALCFLLMGHWIIDLLFVRGKFLSSDGSSLYWCLLILVFSLPFAAVRDLVYRVFYAYKNTKEPFYNSLLATFVNVGVSILLALYLGLVGIVIGTLLSTIVSALRIVIYLNKTQKITII
jgi:putative peptidoglycan lipid II flippase